jgi:Flp pilus assembly protein TadD
LQLKKEPSMKLRPLATLLWLGLGSTLAHAVDTGPPAEPPGQSVAAADKLASAREAIQAKRWADAIAALRRVNDPSSADWNNLMGFALRKSTPPDLAAAERYYEAALRIDPMHRGALEYSGELYLMKNDLPRAEARLAQLQKACPQGCEQLEDLKADIADFKARAKTPPR